MIPATLLDVHITAPYPIDFGANPGSTVRGALYEALRLMYDTGQEVTSRKNMDDNPVAWLLRLEDVETSGGKNVPRPIAIRPPLGPPATKLAFGLSLYGRGRQLLPMVLSALGAMQTIGLGRGRRPFTLAQVDSLDSLTFQPTPLLDGGGDALGELPAPISAEQYRRMAGLLNQELLSVQFLTPARIVQNKRLCKKPHFQAWVQRLLERTRLMSEAYTDAPLWIPFGELLDDARRVKLVDDNTKWQESWSGSRRDGWMRPTSGFVGSARYKGPLSRLLPWLLLGQALQVGKNTVKGCGWYRIGYEWRSAAAITRRETWPSSKISS